MLRLPRNKTFANEKYHALLHAIGFNPAKVFSDPRIVCWRKLADRENCTLDTHWPDGRPIRLHIKRYPPTTALNRDAPLEAQNLRALEMEHIPGPTMVAWGELKDGRGFVMTEDLAGYAPADKLIKAGLAFESILLPTADLTARLHQANLHHRDLYLCHFFVREDRGQFDIRLIDAARIGRLNNFVTRRRWIAKDLSQFWYSTTALPVTDDQRRRWLARYLEKTGRSGEQGWEKSIRAKSDRIADHDRKLTQREPTRHIPLTH